MDCKTYFSSWAGDVNQYLTTHFENSRRSADEVSYIGRRGWDYFEQVASGGKRMRAGLVKLGFEACRGKDTSLILPASAAMEITHASLLVYDDIMDEDIVRHGKPAMHKRYEAYFQEQGLKGDSFQYGESMATCMAIVGCYEGVRLVAVSEFPDDIRNRAINFCTKFLLNTGYGQMLDIELSYRDGLKEEDVLDVSRLKTAWYSVAGPLGLGVILAGGSEEVVRAAEEYGLPVGIAFQLQDDIIGMYGGSDDTGKSKDSDIREGKRTVLYTHALEHGSREQTKRLQEIWGKRDLTSAEADEAREIVKKVGSLDYCRELAYKHSNKAKEVIPQITIDKDLQEVFETLADFVISRIK